MILFELLALLFSSLSALAWPALIIFLLYFFLSRSSTTKRIHHLEKVIEELSAIQKEKPSMTLPQVISEYKNELKRILSSSSTFEEPAAAPASHHDTAVDKEAQPHKEDPTHEADTPSLLTQQSEAISLSWKNWYSDNSINLLLYIGAFLIVASASVFVGFSWEAITGMSKGLFLSFFTFGFFICGVFFYKNEKIRNAGLTFLAIAGILLPFNGIAWHNFYLAPLAFPLGFTWMITSVLSLVYYVSLVYFLRSTFYGYLSAFTSLSCVLAFIHISHLQNEFYILASLISSLILLIAANIFKENNAAPDELITPFTISAHIMMPITLSFGLFFSLSSNTLISVETAIALLLTSLYYYLAFRFSSEDAYLYVAQVLLPIGMFVFGKAEDTPTVFLIVILQVVCYVYLYIASFVRPKDATFILISHILMMLFTFLGIILLTNEFAFFSHANTLLLALFTGYFFLGYILQKDETFLRIVAFLLPCVLFFLGKSYGLASSYALLITQIVTVAYAVVHFLSFKKIIPTQPLFILSQYMTPVIALLVFFVSIENPFNREVLAAGLLLTGYYGMLYYSIRSVWYLTVAESLLFVCAYVYISWQRVPQNFFYYSLEAIPLLYTLLYGLWTRKKLRFERLHTGVIALICYALVFLLTYDADLAMTHIFVFAALPALVSLAFWYISKNPLAIWYNVVFTYISIWLLHFHVIPNNIYEWEATSITLVVLGVGYYTLAILSQQAKANFQTLLIACGLSIFSASLLVIDMPKILLLTNIVTVFLLVDYALRFETIPLFYGVNLMLGFTVWTVARAFGIELVWYPLVFSLFSLALYATSHVLSILRISDIYRKSGLASQLLTVFLFGIYSLPSQGELFKNALASSYVLTILLAYDAKRYKEESLMYVASAVGMLTYLWQMWYLSFSELLVYTIPLGIYFLVLSYFKRLAQKEETATVFDYTGFFFLIAPTLTQMAGEESAYYALFLALEGIGIFILGITLKQKPYIYIGIAALVVAVFSQTYEFLFSLPRWVILAFGGIAFLGTAIYLLLLRDKK